MDGETLTRRHEGEALHPYTDTRGKTTIGIGRNLSDKGISSAEMLMMFQRDYAEAKDEAKAYDWYGSLNEPRQAVIVDMIFELGAAGFRKFNRMHQAIQVGDFHGAVAEMLNSAWAAQVPKRALDDAGIMDTGEWP
ncbi:MAG TPA: glycoside hydrolase family protein [Candidatus Binataceae bacterium]|jgi:lysozyme